MNRKERRRHEKMLRSKKNGIKTFSLERRLDIERKCWKMESPIVDGYGKIIGEKPYFNGYYWDVKRNPNYVEGVSTLTSKEMMEYFLKTANYFYVDVHIDNSIPYYQELLIMSWRKLLGLWIDGKEQGLDDEGYIKGTKDSPYIWFSELEHLITNDKVFFMLFHDVWTYGSCFLTNVEEMFSRYGRNNMSLDERNGCFETFMKNGKYTHSNISNEFFNDLVASDYEDDDYLTLYRSFKVEKGKRVRLSNDRDNPDFTTQVEGKGWSYSLDKFVTVRLGYSLNTHHYSKYCGIHDKDTAIATMKKSGWIGTASLSTIKGFYTCVGEYRVKKKNIIIFTDERKERELIVNPKDVELVDYYFLNIIDYFTERMVWNVIREYETDELSVTNVDDVFDIFRPLFKIFIDKNTGMINEILTSPSYKGVWHKVYNQFLRSVGDSVYLQNYIHEGEVKETKFARLSFSKDNKIIDFIDTRKNLLRPLKEPMLMEYQDITKH
jgi:hypothetical protein